MLHVVLWPSHSHWKCRVFSAYVGREEWNVGGWLRDNLAFNVALALGYHSRYGKPLHPSGLFGLFLSFVFG